MRLGGWVVMLACLLGQANANEAMPRIISADGAITEIIVALSAQQSLVAVDTTSRYPEDVTGPLPKVGYLRALPFEGMLSLRPDWLITSEEAGPEITLQRLQQAGVKVARLPVVDSVTAAVARIRVLGSLTDREPQAEQLALQLESKLALVQQVSAQRDYRPRVLFLLAEGNHGVMLAGRETTADALLSALGADNVMAEVEGYKPVSQEALLASRPDAIIIAETRAGQFRPADWPLLTRLPAWQQGHRLVADSMFLLGFGPRLGEALLAVHDVLPGKQVSVRGR
ncbi:MAG: helical backbone metal receptor [Marinobacter sp.]|nr:helical backbone metal receptor [Marinobacter sp.]